MRRTILTSTSSLRLTIAIVCALVAALVAALPVALTQEDYQYGSDESTTELTTPETITEPSPPDDQYEGDESTTEPSPPETTSEPSPPDDQGDGDEDTTEPPAPESTTPEDTPDDEGDENTTPETTTTESTTSESSTPEDTPDDQYEGDENTTPETTTPDDQGGNDENTTESSPSETTSESAAPETTTESTGPDPQHNSEQDQQTATGPGQPGRLGGGMSSVLGAKKSDQGKQTGTQQGVSNGLDTSGMDGLFEQQPPSDGMGSIFAPQVGAGPGQPGRLGGSMGSMLGAKKFDQGKQTGTGQEQQSLNGSMDHFLTAQPPPSDQASTPPPTQQPSLQLHTFKLCPNGQPSDTSGNCPDEPVEPPCPDEQHEDETGSCVPDETGGNDAGTCQYEDETSECIDQPTGDTCPDGQHEDERGSCLPDYPQTIKEQCADATTYTTRPYYRLGDRFYPCDPEQGQQPTDGSGRSCNPQLGNQGSGGNLVQWNPYQGNPCQGGVSPNSQKNSGQGVPDKPGRGGIDWQHTLTTVKTSLKDAVGHVVKAPVTIPKLVTTIWENHPFNQSQPKPKPDKQLKVSGSSAKPKPPTPTPTPTPNTGLNCSDNLYEQAEDFFLRVPRSNGLLERPQDSTWHAGARQDLPSPKKGASAVISQHAPQVEDCQISLAQIGVYNEYKDPKDPKKPMRDKDRNIMADAVEVGWVVWPEQYEDNEPHLFVKATAGSQADTAKCWYPDWGGLSEQDVRKKCGWVPNPNSKLKPNKKGADSTVVGNAEQYGVRYKQGRGWVVTYGTEELGHFEESFWTDNVEHPFTKFARAEWKGEVHGPAGAKEPPCSEMGNGGRGKEKDAAYINDMELIDSEGNSEPANAYERTDGNSVGNYYDVNLKEPKDSLSDSFSYGGRGEC